jgi:hypothetical protein
MEVNRMKTIRAKVNPRLLSKADRLFTGTVDGRIIEILQNARRAGATEVHIINSAGQVTVQDNGRGIADFAALLDLGRSGWDERTESAEDPAGVGVFCLAPREVCITSGGTKVVIAGKGWTGEPVDVQTADTPVTGTQLVFQDTPWLFEMVEKYAVFAGMKVTVDGKVCAREPFVSERAVPHPELGCRIEVRERGALSRWHDQWRQTWHADMVFVNFHGQVVSFMYAPVSECLQYLVDLTGEPTGIRMMLPARTRPVENEAFGQLKAAIEKEAFQHIQRKGFHRLKFKEYCRAKELGIELPEAQLAFTPGLLSGEPVEPVEVRKPDDWPLERCYRLSSTCQDEGEHNEANAHLLSALGKCENPFVAVEISSDYDGYSWAKLPVVDRVEVTIGKELARQYMCCETLVAVESLEITAYTSDGRVFRSSVPMAVRAVPQGEGRHRWTTIDVLVTLAAREELEPTDIWFHLGGWSEDGDTYDTQLEYFEKGLNLFWADVMGPGEYLRLRLFDCLAEFNLNWQAVSIEANGKVWITYRDGTAKMLQPPQLSAGS